ncbi:MAG: 3-methyl-2-oxobutanoate hydroxymethyltransferase [Desulfovibrio sp.]|nr:3-methyl-2-oxobutanoate hydroxymethyltransferase [Desulfovibrio sp.]
MKNTVITFRQAKGQRKLSMLTAYDYSTAKIMDQSGVDALLVGDSLGMVMLGHPDTLSVTVDDMVRHAAAVARAAASALVICDMPYLSYQISVADCVRHAGRLVTEGGAQAVKLEGGADFSAEIRALTRASIPVMGHLGLTPQSVNALGGYRVQGRSPAAAQKLLDDARAVQEAGAFALVLECVPAGLAARVTTELEIPTIGIGAGAACDGQVLVWQDMLGLCDRAAPKFVKHFGTVDTAMREAFKAFVNEVQAGSFPQAEHCYAIKDEEEMLGHLY